MYKKDNPNLYVRVRRWWKCAKDRSRWHGWLTTLGEDFLPGYHKINKWYWAIRHRTISVFHKIDTGLEPGYYDIEPLMIHGMFALLCRYVESEMGGVAKCEKNINDLETNWGEPPQFDDPEFVEQDRLSRQRQADGVREALRLYKWWKEVYPFYEDKDPWTGKEAMASRAPEHRLTMDSTPCAFDEDGDPKLFQLDFDRGLTPEQVQEKHRLMDESTQYQERCNIEIESAMIALIKLRKSLWT